MPAGTKRNVQSVAQWYALGRWGSISARYQARIAEWMRSGGRHRSSSKSSRHSGSRMTEPTRSRRSVVGSTWPTVTVAISPRLNAGQFHDRCGWPLRVDPDRRTMPSWWCAGWIQPMRRASLSGSPQPSASTDAVIRNAVLNSPSAASRC